MEVKMKKLVFLIILLSFLIMPLGAYYRSVERWPAVSFSLSYGYTTHITDFSTNYGYNWSEADYSVVETGSIASESFGTNFSGSLSLDISITRDFGISLSGASLRQSFDSYADYNMTISWWDGQNNVLNGEGVTPGTISITPLSANLFYNFRFRNGLLVRVYAGVSLFLLKYDLASQTGWGDMYEDEEKYVPDWYAIDVAISGNDQAWGGNLGLELEYRTSRKMSFILGAQYYYVPLRAYLWEVTGSGYHEGQMGFLELNENPDIHNPREITAEVDLSLGRFYGGIRVYF
jgi:hypothetical protein